jgi:uncharacterized protein YjbJ (UPF0337 family)
MSEEKKDDDKAFSAELKESLGELSGKLGSLKDRMKVQLHLGSMEAKKAFEKLEPALERIRTEMDKAASDIEGAADEAEVTAHLGFMEARDRWNHVKEYVSDVAGDVKEQGGKLKGSFDESRLHSHLAAMDAEDKVKERTEKARKKMAEAREAVKTETRASVKSIRDTFDDLLKKLD